MQHRDSCLHGASSAGKKAAAAAHRRGPSASSGQLAQICPDPNAPSEHREASLQGPSLQGTHVSPHSFSPDHLLSSSPVTSSPLISGASPHPPLGHVPGTREGSGLCRAQECVWGHSREQD